MLQRETSVKRERRKSVTENWTRNDGENVKTEESETVDIKQENETSRNIGPTSSKGKCELMESGSEGLKLNLKRLMKKCKSPRTKNMYVLCVMDYLTVNRFIQTFTGQI